MNMRRVKSAAPVNAERFGKTVDQLIMRADSSLAMVKDPSAAVVRARQYLRDTRTSRLRGAQTGTRG
jgi:hypothetical protein